MELFRHLNTTKHKNNEQRYKTYTLSQKNIESAYQCMNCSKTYKYHSGLWRHSSKCISPQNHNHNISLTQDQNTNNETIITPKILLDILKQSQIQLKDNNEMKELLIEQNKTIMELVSKGSNVTNITTNNNNKTFNLQFFLNETCKDAMNIMDFVDSLQLQLTDLENVGKLGYVDGISNIIVKNLKALDIHKRPVHCSDAKREVMYVKDENKWGKEEEDKIKLKKAIKYISDKNINMISEWKEKFPDCVYSDSMKSDQYNHIIIESMGGSGTDNNDVNDNKIIKKLAKEVIIA
jgi:hypothetical protein